MKASTIRHLNFRAAELDNTTLVYKYFSFNNRNTTDSCTFLKENRSIFRCAVAVHWTFLSFCRLYHFQQQPLSCTSFLDNSHLLEEKQHCSSRRTSGRCERMSKTKCTRAEGRCSFLETALG